ncbi:VOC family protein [Streptomyces sp. JJ36]|uniref:VOC family protein n=1 Tax=Streptomyces sp. JJ36 TaxID=2736645 RepID=UPI001F4620B6|nr:VOC family protein [Streptomyces sp. JJ36]MCF6524287.1 VOC family protein [Streptomyces sp. JJ36]
MSTSETQHENHPPAPDTWPIIQAQDAPALIDFLTGTVGFLRTAVHTDGDLVAHAQLDWPEGGGVMLSSVREDGHCVSPPGSGATYVVTADVDGLYEKLRAAGVRFTAEPEDKDYGGRDFTMTDPEGNTWSFGTYPGEPRG